jgi:transcriptional regulator with XRE-family HTH domain
MDARLVSKYLTALKEKNGITYEAIAEKSKRSESTVKNLITGKTEDPRLDTVAPVIYAMGGSLDEMFTGHSKDTTKEITINSVREIYEHQLEEIAKTNETHINNIRNHYEQHRQDVKENYEKLLCGKVEILEQKDKHIETLKKEIISSKIFSWICVAILVGLLIAEVMNPNLGWLRY